MSSQILVPIQVRERDVEDAEIQTTPKKQMNENPIIDRGILNPSHIDQIPALESESEASKRYEQQNKKKKKKIEKVEKSGRTRGNLAKFWGILENLAKLAETRASSQRLGVF